MLYLHECTHLSKLKLNTQNGKLYLKNYISINLIFFLKYTVDPLNAVFSFLFVFLNTRGYKPLVNGTIDRFLKTQCGKWDVSSGKGCFWECRVTQTWRVWETQ